MQIHILSIGNKMPGWVSDGYAEYARRMPRECQLNLLELPPAQRSKTTDLKKALIDEGQRLLKAVPKNADVVVLDVKGKQHSTESLADELKEWLNSGRDIALLIGGADGLSAECIAAAKSKWSLSKLTFPHPLVRVILSEQLYRAWSLLNNHPYHRA
jgi:23S rRNA (pseudouridine1915-N3)-methyltransferase